MVNSIEGGNLLELFFLIQTSLSFLRLTRLLYGTLNKTRITLHIHQLCLSESRWKRQAYRFRAITTSHRITSSKLQYIKESNAEFKDEELDDIQ